ncbi:MAG: hypothetical protein EA402_09040 [Planctomycetota bacterium]|nr:MAG: hypothetical protein EA402_09040 [Planctomycetota bacterium]
MAAGNGLKRFVVAIISRRIFCDLALAAFPVAVTALLATVGKPFKFLHLARGTLRYGHVFVDRNP